MTVMRYSLHGLQPTIMSSGGLGLPPVPPLGLAGSDLHITLARLCSTCYCHDTMPERFVLTSFVLRAPQIFRSLGLRVTVQEFTEPLHRWAQRRHRHQDSLVEIHPNYT